MPSPNKYRMDNGETNAIHLKKKKNPEAASCQDREEEGI